MQPEKPKKSIAGPIAFAVKIGGKIMTLLAKLIKVSKVAKVALTVASFGAYATLFSWQFALVLMGCLLLHEFGHIAAMKHNGMKTKGVFFIPFLGAAAVSEDSFETHAIEAEVALAGPFAGLGISVVLLVIYLCTGIPLIAALASWNGLLNLFNLMPINPMDGGRVWKAIGFSIHGWIGVVVMGLGIVAALAGTFYLHLYLLVVIAVVGAIELASAVYWRHNFDKPKMSPLECSKAFIAHTGLAALFLLIMNYVAHIPAAGAALEVFKS